MQRINAMISVHAHAEAKKVMLPKQLRIMPLNDAVKFLAADAERDYFGKARRHRAIAKLFGYDRRLFRAQLLALTGRALLQQLEVQIADGGNEKEKEQEVNDKLVQVDGAPFKDCTPSTLSYNVDATDPMTISATIDVKPSSFATLQRALDPQNWDICSKFWKPPERTYLGARTGSTVTMKPAKPSDQSYRHEMYEHFSTVTCTSTWWGNTCHTADFQNMLDITTTPGPGQTYRAEYDFVAPPIQGTMDGNAVTITIDDGHVAATPASTDRWTVEGKKYLKFTETIANDWARAAFGYAVKELAAELSDIACCDVTVVSSQVEAPTLTHVDSVP